MPKRKIKDSLMPPEKEAETLALLKDAYKQPAPATQRGLKRNRTRVAALPHAPESAGWVYDSPWAVGVEQHVIVKRRRKGHDVVMYRTPGKAGADLDVPPFYLKLLKQQRDFDAAFVKATRRPPKHVPTHSRERIRSIAATIPEGRGRIKAIARAAGCSVDTVRRALSQ